MTPATDMPEFVPAPEPVSLSEPARLAGVFFSPGAAFADIARKPRWWVPVLLSTIVTTAYLYLFSQRVGWVAMIEKQLDQNPSMPAQQRQAAINIYANYGGVITFASGLIIPIVASLVIALVLKFLADVVMGAGVGFKRLLAVCTYAGLPNLLQTGLAAIVMYLKPPDEFDLQNPLMFNVGAFLPPDSPRWMLTGAGSLDLFTFWVIALMAIGIHAAAGKKMSTGKAFGMILFPWALYVILRVGSAAAFGG
ncbi:MAG: YIP1 family protein [Acidobacteriota bacterium]